MNILHLVLVILSLACFLVAALEVSVRRSAEPARYVNLIAAGLFFWLASELAK